MCFCLKMQVPSAISSEMAFFAELCAEKNVGSEASFLLCFEARISIAGCFIDESTIVVMPDKAYLCLSDP